MTRFAFPAGIARLKDVLSALLVLAVMAGCAAPAPQATPKQPEKKALSKADLLKFWENHYKEGEEAFHHQEFKKAEEELHLALKRLKESGIRDERLGATLHRLGSVYLADGKLKKAEPYLLDALKNKEEYLGKESPELMKTLNNLGKLYLADGKRDRAEPLLKKALNIGESQLGANDEQLIIPLINLGILYYDREEYSESEAMFERALHVAEVNNSGKQVIIMSNLVEIYRKTQRESEATAMERRVNELNRKS